MIDKRDYLKAFYNININTFQVSGAEYYPVNFTHLENKMNLMLVKFITKVKK